LQTLARFADDCGEAGGFSSENATPCRGEAVVAAAGIVVCGTAAKFLHPLAPN
jgi:hypothetical protein